MFETFTAVLAIFFACLALAAHLRHYWRKTEFFGQDELDQVIQTELARKSVKTNFF